jgi:hypothetical protein
VRPARVRLSFVLLECKVACFWGILVQFGLFFFFFFLISNVNFIKSAEGRNPKKYIYKKTPMKYTKDTYAKILLLLVSHYGNEPLSTHVA